MESRTPRPRDLAGALIWLALLGIGLWLSGWLGGPPRPAPASVADGVTWRLELAVPAGTAAARHRGAISLGQPARLRLTVHNPAGVTGRIAFGPPTALAAGAAEDPADRAAVAFDLGGAAEEVFTWLDLAVGTKALEVTLAREAPLGFALHAADPDAP